MKSKFFLFLLLGIILNLSLRIYFHRADYLTKYDPEYWHNRYLKSQWVTPKSQESIGDDGLYSYVGWEYVHGADPSLLNPEMPPLGKIIIGATTVLFGNQNIQALFFGIGALFLLYHLARVFLTRTLAIFVVYLFSLEPIFTGQINISLLDLQELFFLILSLFFFLRFLKNKRILSLFLSLLFLGVMMAVKFFVVALILGMAYLIALFFLKRRALFTFFLLSSVIPVVYLLSYAGYFFNHHSFRDFLGVQKWILVFHKSSLAFAFPGGPFWMMLFNRWESWFGGLWYRDHVIIPAPDWQITWPILILLTGVSVFKLARQTLFKKEYLFQARSVLTIWIFVYLFFLSLIPIFPRYLLLTIPFMYLLSLDFLFNLNFWRKIYSFLKAEFQKYKKDYLFWTILFWVIFFWKINPALSGNFILSPQFAIDLTLTRNIIFGLTPLWEPSLFVVLKFLLLSLPYFLNDGHPQNLVIFLVLFPFFLTFALYYFFRKKSRKILLILSLPIIFLLFLFYQVVWKIPVFSFGENKEWIFKNEKEVLDFTYRDSKIYRFASLPLSKESSSNYYQFLYQWYETRKWHGKNVPVGDNEMQILYLIVEPTYKIKNEERDLIAKIHNLKFRFEKKFSSGVLVYKFDRLVRDEDLKNEKK